jgi:L-asparaginase II
LFKRVVNVYRGDIIESSHCGHFAVVDADGKMLYQLGDPQMVTYLRSSAKPFQTIPLVESGAAAHFKFTSQEIAIISGSHNGQSQHIAVVNSILEKIGLSEADLKCGVHIPHYYTANKIKPKPDEEFSQLQHNCSGKHAGMLALCVFKNLPTENYLDPEHPVQKLITEAIGYICDYPVEKIGIGIDGCSAPVHALPIYNMALGFARFVTPHSVPRDKSKVYSTIYQAMLEHPDMVAGTGRYDYDLMVNCQEKLIAKSGAEGLHCIGLIERGWGIAAKISDGARRALYPFSLEILKQLGLVTSNELTKLKPYQREIIYNWNDKEVGYIKAEFEIER